MKNPLHLLILIGLLCQGWSSSDWILPLAYALGWFACLKMQARRPILMNGWAEGSLLLGGAVVGFVLSKAFDISSHFFVGHGLAALQLGRLLRPLQLRERRMSLLIASFHIAVGCTVILDYKFLAVLVAALIVLPRAFTYLLQQEYDSASSPSRQTLKINWVGHLLIVASMIFFFLIFPRGWFSSPLQLQRGDSGGQGTLLDSVVDPSRSASLQSSRVLLQIQGDRLGYLRALALTRFDGQKWSSEEPPSVRSMPEQLPPGRSEADLLQRRVRVKDVNYLGRSLPTDGGVVRLEGKIVRGATISNHGMAGASMLLNTANNVYNYSTTAKLSPYIDAKMRSRCLQHPPPSEPVRRWLNQVVPDTGSPLSKARRLETYLRDNFTYELGGPELSRITPIDDFLLVSKSGHCERYASALAYLLRVQGVPSRVVIGYLPSAQGWRDDWYNIRFSDAHAWTEAYLEGEGWISLDATPRSSEEPSSRRWSEMLSTLDFFWYSHVVGFDVQTQSGLWNASFETIKKFAGWLQKYWWVGFISGVVLFLIIYSIPRIKKQSLGGLWPRWKRSTPPPEVLAEHYYGQMLRALRRMGCHRLQHETPREFLESHRAALGSHAVFVEQITEFFHRTRYGARVPSEEETQKIERSLHLLMKTKRS